MPATRPANVEPSRAWRTSTTRNRSKARGNSPHSRAPTKCSSTASARARANLRTRVTVEVRSQGVRELGVVEQKHLAECREVDVGSHSNAMKDLRSRLHGDDLADWDAGGEHAVDAGGQDPVADLDLRLDRNLVERQTAL